MFLSDEGPTHEMFDFIINIGSKSILLYFDLIIYIYISVFKKIIVTYGVFFVSFLNRCQQSTDFPTDGFPPLFTCRLFSNNPTQTTWTNEQRRKITKRHLKKKLPQGLPPRYYFNLLSFWCM